MRGGRRPVAEPPAESANTVMERVNAELIELNKRDPRRALLQHFLVTEVIPKMNVKDRAHRAFVERMRQAVKGRRSQKGQGRFSKALARVAIINEGRTKGLRGKALTDFILGRIWAAEGVRLSPGSVPFILKNAPKMKPSIRAEERDDLLDDCHRFVLGLPLSAPRQKRKRKPNC